MGSEGDDDDSVDSEEGSGDAMAEEGDGDADMDADSSGAEEMEDLAGDEARAGSAAVAVGVLAAASNENIQPVVLQAPAPQKGALAAMGQVNQVNCGADANAAASKQANAIDGGALPV